MKVNFSMGTNMEKEKWLILQEIIMKVNGNMIKKRGKNTTSSIKKKFLALFIIRLKWMNKFKCEKYCFFY